MSSGASSVVASPHRINRGDSSYPRALVTRLGEQSPASLVACGNIALLTKTKTALFCSTRCPGDAILRAYDQAAKWRDAGRCVISGFHSPVEKECLRILLRGHQPIIICPARSLPKRVPAEWREPLANGRLLILSCFSPEESRPTSELATRRNELVAALADEVFIIHATPRGHIARLSEQL